MNKIYFFVFGKFFFGYFYLHSNKFQLDFNFLEQQFQLIFRDFFLKIRKITRIKFSHLFFIARKIACEENPYVSVSKIIFGFIISY